MIPHNAAIFVIVLLRHSDSITLHLVEYEESILVQSFGIPFGLEIFSNDIDLVGLELKR